MIVGLMSSLSQFCFYLNIQTTSSNILYVYFSYLHASCLQLFTQYQMNNTLRYLFLTTCQSPMSVLTKKGGQILIDLAKSNFLDVDVQCKVFLSEGLDKCCTKVVSSKMVPQG